MMDIKLENLNKKYGENTVLSNFCAEFKQGEITCLMGPSGWGKTTLFNILMGFETADSGHIAGMPKQKSAVFQEDRLCEEFSALSNIRLVTGKRVEDAVILQHLTELGLQEDLAKPLGEFSGGMKRRVAVARSVLFDADIYLMDEPFKGLDAATKTVTMDYVKKHTKGKTLVVITHDEDECAYLGGSLIKVEKYNGI